MANRFRVDCRKHPGDKSCAVTISGALEELLELGWLHASKRHCHKDEEEKRARIASATIPRKQTINQNYKRAPHHEVHEVAHG